MTFAIFILSRLYTSCGLPVKNPTPSLSCVCNTAGVMIKAHKMSNPAYINNITNKALDVSPRSSKSCLCEFMLCDVMVAIRRNATHYTQRKCSCKHTLNYGIVHIQQHSLSMGRKAGKMINSFLGWSRNHCTKFGSMRGCTCKSYTWPVSNSFNNGIMSSAFALRTIRFRISPRPLQAVQFVGS